MISRLERECEHDYPCQCPDLSRRWRFRKWCNEWGILTPPGTHE